MASIFFLNSVKTTDFLPNKVCKNFDVIINLQNQKSLQVMENSIRKQK